jgi:peptidoglycan/xylan/chitin deacetylase (PgdA/CDA1 family)
MSPILVLGYHGLSDTWPDGTAVRPDAFEAQVESLVRRGYRGTTFTDALTAPRADKTVAITFDDACRSVLEHAFPVLTRLGLPATVFVPTAYAGTDRPMGWAGFDRWLGTPHEGELACMSWEALETLADAGWEVGSHTHSHPRLPTLHDDELARELRESRDRIEARLARPCRSIAYPYGVCDHRVAEATRTAGYGFGCVLYRQSTPRLPLQWPRVGVYRADTPERLLARAARREWPRLDAAAATATGWLREGPRQTLARSR